MTEESSPRFRLLEEAQKLFSVKSFSGVSVREIAKNAGANPAMISYYFGGKEGLYREILENAMERIEEQTLDLHDPKIPPRERIGFYVRGVIRLHRHNPHYARILLQEIQNPSSNLSKIVLPRISRMARGIRQALQEGQDRGEFRSDIPPPLGAYFVASVANFYFLQASLVHSVVPEIGAQDALLEESILKIFFEGMGKKCDASS